MHDGQYVRVAMEEVEVGGMGGVKEREGEGKAVNVRKGTGGEEDSRQCEQWHMVVVSGGAVPVMTVWPQEQLPQNSMAVDEREALSERSRFDVTDLQSDYMRLGKRGGRAPTRAFPCATTLIHVEPFPCRGRAKGETLVDRWQSRVRGCSTCRDVNEPGARRREQHIGEGKVY